MENPIKYFEPETSNLEILTSWNKEFGHDILDKNQVPNIPNRDLRLALIFEELSELATAYGREGQFTQMLSEYLGKQMIKSGSSVNFESLNTDVFDRKESLDALTDLEVVVLGGYNVSGFTGIAKEAFNETMNSNFSKSASSIEEVHDSVDYYQKQGIEVEGRRSNSGKFWIIVNKITGKILKNQKSFKKPNYSNLLKNED